MEIPVKNIDNACEVAEEFTKLYYKQIDNSRHLTSKLYTPNSLLVWNGNGVNGCDQIQKFLLDLPGSTHILKTLDAQPLAEGVVGSTLSYLIQACGDVTYQNEEARKPFQQTFLIVAVEDKWKIASDCFRLQVPISLPKQFF